MRKVYLLLLLPLAFSCISISGVSITSLTREDLVSSREGKVFIPAGDLVELTFSLDSTRCRYERTENLKILLGNDELVSEEVEVYPGTIETKRFLFRVPSSLTGENTISIVIGGYKKNILVNIYKISGDFLIVNNYFEFIEGKYIEHLKIANLREDVREFSIFVNGKKERDLIFSSRLMDVSFEFKPVLGINTIEVCDEENICKKVYEYIQNVTETKVTRNQTMISEKKGVITPFLLLPLSILVGFLAYFVVVKR